jgi:hypothetical protein
MTTPPRSVKIAVSVELVGDWVTVDMIAELATELSARAAHKLAELSGEALDPGKITLGVRTGEPPA